MFDLDNKRILLIMPKYFGYEQEIYQFLSNSGAHVHTLFENINDTSLLYKTLFFFAKSKKKKFCSSYYRKAIEQIQDKPDIVLVIRGSTISQDTISFMKNGIAADSRYIMYQWDGVKNNPNALEIASFFDSICTFDLTDAKTYGWKYRPLFFISHFIDKAASKTTDISFIGSMHSMRYKVLTNLKQICARQNLKLRTHLYINRIVYFKHKYISKKAEFKEIPRNNLNFKSLSLEDAYTIYGNSKIIVDYTHPEQTGFTMRTIEALGNGCKLITNNPLIKSADFYDPNNVLVYEGTDVEIPDWFIQTPYNMPDESIYQKYTLAQWLEELFTL